MSSSRVFFYLLVLALIFFALRPRESWKNLRELYTYRKWVIGVLSTILLFYLLVGLWQIWRAGLWWW